jgi:hypothetical protein
MNYSLIVLVYIIILLVIITIGLFVLSKKMKASKKSPADNNSLQVIGDNLQIATFDAQTMETDIIYIPFRAITLVQAIPNTDRTRFRLKIWLSDGQIRYTYPVMTEIQALQQLKLVLRVSGKVKALKVA